MARFNIPSARLGVGWSHRRRSISGSGAAGLGREVLLELAVLALVLVGVLRRRPLARDIGPLVGVVAVQLEPALRRRFGVRQDRVHRAFRLANAAVDALVGVDDQHVLALVEAVHGA